jgi:Cu-processing system permease protein
MKPISTLASLALKEYYRRKILIVILLMMFLVAGTGLLSNPFTLGVQGRLMRDLALWFIELFTVFFSLALAAGILPNEIERKLVYPFLARPISRSQYLWGKFWAISLIVGASDFILGLELVLILRFSISAWHWMVLGACLLLWIEAMVVIAFCLWFSTFMTAPVTFASMVLLYVLGNLSHVYALTLTTGNPIMQWILLRIKSIIPYFDYFSIRSAVTHNHPVSFFYFVACILYGIFYVLLAMLLAEAVFAGRDL